MVEEDPFELEERRQKHAFIAALLTILVWGANFSVQKFVFGNMTPAGFLFARYLLMPACAFALLVAVGGGRRPRFPRGEFWPLLRLGVVGHTIHVSMVSFGIHWSTAFSSCLILACGPVFTLLILRWQKIEHLRPAQILGVAVACAGVLVFLSDKLLAGRWQATGGDLFLLFASSLFSYYTVASKPLIVRIGGVPTMAWATLLGSGPIVVFSYPLAIDLPWSSLPWTVWAAFLWAVLISAFLGWIVWGWVNMVRGVARSAPLQYLMPPVAGAVAWFVNGEHFSATKLAGAAITMGGVALAQFASKPDEPAREASAPVD